MRWDLIIMALSIYTSFSVPFEVAFLEYEDTTIQYEISNYVIDIFFCIDIVLNFFTTVIDPLTGTELDEKS